MSAMLCREDVDLYVARGWLSEQEVRRATGDAPYWDTVSNKGYAGVQRAKLADEIQQHHALQQPVC